MDEIFDEVVSSEDLKRFEGIYNQQVQENNLTQETQFNYAWCLVRSRYAADIRKGICILETLFQNNDLELRRDCVYYLALGNAKLKEYNTALEYVRTFLNIEPGNEQVQTLEACIKKRMEKNGLFGMAIAGGAALALGGLVTLGVALSRGGK